MLVYMYIKYTSFQLEYVKMPVATIYWLTEFPIFDQYSHILKHRYPQPNGYNEIYNNFDIIISLHVQYYRHNLTAQTQAKDIRKNTCASILHLLPPN